MDIYSLKIQFPMSYDSLFYWNVNSVWLVLYIKLSFSLLSYQLFISQIHATIKCLCQSLTKHPDNGRLVNSN